MWTAGLLVIQTQVQRMNSQKSYRNVFISIWQCASTLSGNTQSESQNKWSLIRGDCNYKCLPSVWVSNSGAAEFLLWIFTRQKWDIAWFTLFSATISWMRRPKLALSQVLPKKNKGFWGEAVPRCVPEPSVPVCRESKACDGSDVHGSAEGRVRILCVHQCNCSTFITWERGALSLQHKQPLGLPGGSAGSYPRQRCHFSVDATWLR